MSARAQTSSAVARIVPPAATYAWSVKPLPTPAPSSTNTWCPAATSASVPAGTSATRFSLVLISLGTPISMRAFSLRALLRTESGEGLPVRREELGRDAGDIVPCDGSDLGEHFVQRAVPVSVQHESRQAPHATDGALQRQHDLPLQLLLAIGELVGRQPVLGEPAVLGKDRLDRLVGSGRLGSHIHAELARALEEMLVGIDGVGEAELLAHSLEKSARHPAAERVDQDGEGKAARVAQRKGVGAEHHVSLLRVSGLLP